MSVITHEREQVVSNALREISHIATLPEVTVKVVELVESPKSTAQDLHKVISTDPALCTRILKVVNSSFYGLPGQVGSINRAIVMLGLNAVKNIAIARGLTHDFLQFVAVVLHFNHQADVVDEAAQEGFVLQAQFERSSDHLGSRSSDVAVSPKFAATE
jgi:HD-like signal output (HDOD) protein